MTALTDIDPQTALLATGFGFLAGVRSLSAPALVSNYLAENRSERVDDTPVGFLATSQVGTALQALAVGEAIADKLPFMPARTAWPSMAWRAFAGGLAGATVAAVNRRNLVLPALMGGAAALAGAYAAYHLRTAASERLPVPSAALGIAEDALVLGGGAALVRATRREAASA